MNKGTITVEELNAYIVNLSDQNGRLPKAKSWVQVDNFKDIELWVGDGLYVVSIIKDVPKTKTDLEQNALKAKDTVLKWLQDEGFITHEHFYVGLQDLPVNKLPTGLTLGDE